MNPENGKKTYESIEIPKNLNETVMQTIASKKKEELKMKYESNENKKASETKKSYRPVWRGCVAAAAAVLVAGTIGLNTSPVFAENMSKVPVVGQLAQVLTFRSFEGTEGDVELNVPAFWNPFPRFPCRLTAVGFAIITASLSSGLKTAIRSRCRITGWKTATPGALNGTNMPLRSNSAALCARWKRATANIALCRKIISL